MSKYYLDPDTRQSIDSGMPKPWLSPDMAQAISAHRRKQWTPPDIASDIDAIADTGGGGGDAALPVAFNGFTCVVNSAPTVTDSPLIGFSLWADSIDTNNGSVLFFSEGTTNGTNLNTLGFELGPSEFRILLTDNGSGNFVSFTFDKLGAVGGMHHIMGAIDTNHGAGAKIVALYIDDAYIPKFTRASDDPSDAFTAPLNGVPFSIGALENVGAAFTGNMQFFWLDTGVAMLDGSNRIPEVIRRKFINSDGTPADVGADGSTPFGSAPAFYHAGDAAAFVTNNGTAGASALNEFGEMTDGEVEVSVTLGLPENTVAPVVSGTAQVGQTLSCTTGTWTGTTPIAYTYQWYSGTGNDVILGETNSTILMTPEMDIVGQVIFCRVHAQNSLWTNSAKSNVTAPLAPA